MTNPSSGGFYEAIVRRPIGLCVIFLTLVVVSVITYVRIPIQMLPNGLRGTRLSVWINHPGSGAQENEEKVARILEEQFRTLQGIDDIWSSSADNSVRVGVAFSGRTDMDLAKAELRDRIERARPLLPSTVDRIFVWAHDDDDLPVMFFAVLQKEPSAKTDYLVEHEIQRRLEAIDGISRVQIWGLLDDSVRILLDEDKVKAARLDVGKLVRRLMTDNFAAPLGDVEDGGRQFLLRSDMRFHSLEDIERYPLGDGLTIGDIARVERVKTVRDWLTRIDGHQAYYGMVQKESTANVVEVGHALESAIEELGRDKQLVGTLKIEPLFNQAHFIENSLASLRHTALVGGLLAVAVLFVFLRRVRMTIAVALSIPISALLSIAWEYFGGGTFNVLTMTGLTLGIGMLVDNSIVVIENIASLYARGRSPVNAATQGTAEVALAVGLATLTSVIVFLPIIFMSDSPQLRVMLGALGIPLCTSLLFSLLVALVFLPVLAARILGGRPRAMSRAADAFAPIAHLPARIVGAFVGLLRICFHGLGTALFHATRGAIAILTPLRWPLALALVGVAVWRAAPRLELVRIGRTLSAQDVSLSSTSSAGGLFGLQIALALAGALVLLLGLPRWRARPARPPARPEHWALRGTSIVQWIQDGNRALLRWTLEHRLLASTIAFLVLLTIVWPQSHMTVAAFGQDEETSEIEIEVEMEENFTLAQTSREMKVYEEFLEGHREEFGFEHLVASFQPGGGSLDLRWEAPLDRKVFEQRREFLRQRMPRRAGHVLRFSGDEAADAMSRQFVQFQLRGPDAQSLERYGQQALAILKRVPGLLDVSSPLEAAPEQVQLTLDADDAFKYGVTTDMAMQSVAWALRGAMLPRYQDEGREVPFYIEYDTTNLAGLDTLRDLEVYTQQSVVPLSTFAEIEFQRGQREIFRWNGQTTFNVQARVEEPARQKQIVEAGYDALEALDLPRGFSLGRDDSVITRQAEEMAEMMRALQLSVLLVFLVMGILFESILLPFAVLTTIPFAVLGAFWTLYLTGTSMDSVGWIGIIILVGVVVNNGIVLIDKIHRLRVEGYSRKDSVAEGAAARVRPIVMTAMTTIFGLLPLALGEAQSEGIDYRALATCVAGGLAASTFFALWVVPLAYTVFEDLWIVLSDVLRRVRRQPRVRAPREEVAAGAES